jgi:hypothetical protein
MDEDNILSLIVLVFLVSGLVGCAGYSFYSTRQRGEQLLDGDIV